MQAVFLWEPLPHTQALLGIFGGKCKGSKVEPSVVPLRANCQKAREAPVYEAVGAQSFLGKHLQNGKLMHLNLMLNFVKLN